MRNLAISQILEKFHSVVFHGNKDLIIHEVIGLDSVGDNPNALAWVTDKKSPVLGAKDFSLGVLICTKSAFEQLRNKQTSFLVTENPRQLFAAILKEFFSHEITPAIMASAFVHSTAVVGQNCFVGHRVVVEENCVIGDNTVILHNTVIMAGNVIGKNVYIGCNNTIGNYGFGYEKNETGNNELIPHLGNVVIKDRVEIHNNVCIDRALLGSTVIEENVKVDNLVHIAHGVKIGSNSLIIANAMIGGSATIGDNTWMAPSSSVKNQIHVSSDTVVGMNAVVLKDVGDRATVVGNPAQPLDEYKAWSEKKKKILRES